MRISTLALFGACAGCLAAGCGSGGEMSKQDESAFKQSIDTGKEKLDPNDVPPEVRDRVKAIMDAQKPPGASR
ncbi:MAG TPA: hypothetical protein VGE01_03740 [Fimbriimonas sp.]